MPGDRPHDVSDLTDAELERARRDLQVSLALAFLGAAEPRKLRVQDLDGLGSRGK